MGINVFCSPDLQGQSNGRLFGQVRSFVSHSSRLFFSLAL